MKNKRKFSLSLLATGLIAPPTNAALPAPAAERDAGGDQPTLYDVFELDHSFTLAQHRSHSSHRSHGSHRSSSGGGGGGYRPAPVPRSPPPPPPPPRPDNSESTAPSSILPRPSEPARPLSGRSQRFNEILSRVQAALYAYGYYHGAIDGLYGPQTQAAITAFQTDRNLTVTGTVTPEVLNALGITAQ